MRQSPQAPQVEKSPQILLTMVIYFIVIVLIKPKY